MAQPVPPTRLPCTGRVPAARNVTLASVVVANTANERQALADVPSFEDLTKITYDEPAAPRAAATSAFDTIDLSSDNSLALVGGLAVGVALVGGVVYAVTSGQAGSQVQSVSTNQVLALLAGQDTQLLDVRPREAIREEGSPDLRSVKKSPVAVSYKPSAAPAGSGSQMSTVTLGWADRLKRVSKVKSCSTVVILDSDGSVAPTAAREVAKAKAGPTKIYYVSGGGEAWRQAELPWKDALKIGINLNTLKAIDISGVAARTEKIVEKYKSNPTLINGGVAAVAVAGASVFLFSEIEAIMQVVGAVVAFQFLASKLVFAQDRQKTLQDIKYLIQDKIAAGQAGDDLRRLADKVLDVDTAEDTTEEAQRLAAGNGASSSDGAGAVPQNVQSARDWIAQWREKNKATISA